MNEDTIVALLAHFDARRGPAALLRLVGFERPLLPLGLLPDAPRPGVWPSLQVRALQTTRRTTLCAYVVRLRARCTTELIRCVARGLRSADPLSHQLLLFVEPRAERIVLCCAALDDGVRSLAVEPGRARRSDVEALIELLPVAAESDTAAAIRIARALDRSRVTTRFFRDVTASRDLIARSWTGLPADAQAERDALALLLLSRLLFLYFLQRRGLLAGDTQFLPHLLRSYVRSRPRTSFYTTTLRTLFFGVLNRRRERRTQRALELGELPYLNGGLFERHAMERHRPTLDLDDDVVARVLDDLLEKYRFTAAEDSDGAICGGIDPEMLGRIFEGLMPGDRRARTGTFYTPQLVVQRVARETLAEHLGGKCGVAPASVSALFDGSADAGGEEVERLRCVAAGLRVLDPACGSGAFLLGALGALGTLATRTSETRDHVAARRAIVANTLYGVDLLDDAALICSLRLWLSLVPDCDTPADVPPLPNLDRRIRQGDALIDPLDIAAAAPPARLRPLLRALAPVASAYLGAGPETRGRLRRELHRLERRLARCWLDTLERAVALLTREQAARAQDRDLFDEPTRAAVYAQRALPTLRRRTDELKTFRDDVASARSLPFFSFRIHFAEAADGFDVVLSNPPWIRSHNWPPTVRQVLRERYTVCGDAGWPYASTLAGSTRAAGAQVDLSLLFLERGVRLLAPGGTLGMLLPAKLIRSLYAGGARALLLRSMHVVSIEDHSLDHRAVFDADAFTAVVIARRPIETDAGPSNAGSSSAGPSSADPGGARVRVRVTRPDREELRFELAASDLPLRAGDDRAPWLLAPAACAAALRTMQRTAPSIGEQALPVRRGAMTGANDVMIVREVEPKIGDLAHIRTDGWYRAGADTGRRAFSGLVEASSLRPALRGTDVHRWNAEPARHVLWSPANDAQTRPGAARRLERFLNRNRARLGDADPPGTLQRLNEYTLGHKVVWSDLAADLRAAAVQPLARSAAGCTVPVVPLNTVYFVATTSYDESLLLAAYLNSMPLRTFARAIAERAKDAHFRFFAWTIAVLPLPRDWRSNNAAAELLALSCAAHTRGNMTADETHRLDTVVARAYGLNDDELENIASFDRWLS